MPTKIPQDVTREDKLVGPLTLRQFLYILGAAGLIFIAYQYYALQYLYFIAFILISLLIALLALALAFAQINGRPFGVFLLNVLHFLLGDRSLIWHKESRDVVTAIKVHATDLKDTKTELQERKSGKQIKMQIEQLANVLDTGGTMKPDISVTTSTISNLNASPAPSAEPVDVEDVLKDVD